MIPLKMKKYILSAIFMMVSLLMGSVVLTSCDGEDDLDTNQFTGGVSLNAYGPSPVARGGELQFIGCGLNQITSIEIPGCDAITDITVVNNNKITIIVPKTAQPGYPVLKYAKGEIVTKTKLTFTEPVGFAEKEAFASSIKPGQTLTIKGSYLNLVQSIIFAEDVEVTQLEKSSAAEPMNMTIKVVVPEEAQTGKIYLGFIATGDSIMNKVMSEEELNVVLPSVAKVADLTGKKPGDVIEIEGSDLDLVKTLLVADDTVKFTVSGNKISFTLPDNTPAEAVVSMYPASGIKVTLATIGMKLPAVTAITPNSELRDSMTIEIAGTDLDVVDSVYFAGNKKATFELKEGKIIAVCPENFISGKITLYCKSGVEVTTDSVYTQKPKFTSFEAATVSMGNDVVINGENLDLVSNVTYAGGLEGEVKSGSATQIVVSMPTSGVESGAIVLNMANGESTETAELTIDAPVFCYLISPEDLITTDDKVIKAGSVITTVCENGDHLTGVLVDGEATQYIINGTTLILLTTENAGFDSKLKLVSDNGEIEYNLSVVPNTQKKVVLWSGMTELSWTDGGRVFITGKDLEAIPEGAILHFCFTQKDNEWGQAQVNNGWWKNSDISTFTREDGTQIANPIVPTDIYGWFNDGILNRDLGIVLTADLRSHLLSHVGDDGFAIIIQGQNLIFTQVYATWEISLETDIIDFTTFENGSPLTYPFTLSWNDAASGKLRIKRDGLGKMKIGSKIFIYKEGTGQAQFNNPNWTALYTAEDWAGNVNPLEVVIDETLMKCISGEVNDGWSTTAFIVQGQGLKVTKMTILP